MLPARARLTRREDFRLVVGQGTRVGRRSLVVHALSGEGPQRVGFVVSAAVGSSVVRHRVVRRLRHLVAARLDALPNGCRLVVRALPPAAGASSAELGADLDAALERVGRVTS